MSITAILEQYLAYLDEMKRLDMEIASEFITMASHLMVIKTKMLLSASEQAEAESEMELLRQSLVRGAGSGRKSWSRSARPSSFLEGRNEIGRGLFTKGPESRPRESGYRYQHEPADSGPGPWRPLPSAPAAVCRPPASSFSGALWGRNPSL
ncbi:MAG: segregation/condensation protein A [Oscillospiraceae bacterium]